MSSVEFSRTISVDPVWAEVLEERDRLVELIFSTYYNGVYDYNCRCKNCTHLFTNHVTRLEKGKQNCPLCFSSNYEMLSSNVGEDLDPTLVTKINRYLNLMKQLDLRFNSPEEVVWPTFPTP